MEPVISHADGVNANSIAYASRTLTPAEKDYFQIEKEVLAIIFGVTKFHSYLYERNLRLLQTIYPKLQFLGPRKAFQFWLLHDCSVGLFNCRLTSLTLNNVLLGNTKMLTLFDRKTEQIHKIQKKITCDYVQTGCGNKEWCGISRVMEFSRSGLSSLQHDTKLLPYFRVRNELTIQDGCLLRGIRIVIPERYRQDVLEELHDSHPWMARMKSSARLHVWCAGLDSDIKTKVSQCGPCRSQLSKLP